MFKPWQSSLFCYLKICSSHDSHFFCVILKCYSHASHLFCVILKRVQAMTSSVILKSSFITFSRICSFITFSLQLGFIILQHHIFSNASIHFSPPRFIVSISEPYNVTGQMHVLGCFPLIHTVGPIFTVVNKVFSLWDNSFSSNI